MKRITFPVFVTLTLLSILPITGCKPQSRMTSDKQEQEVQRRVAQKLAEEKVAQQAAALDQKAQDIAARERNVAAREQSVTPTASAPQTPDQPLNATEQDSAAIGGTPVDDQVGGAPSSSYDLFYNKLASEGDWFDAPPYGLVWRPAVAARSPGWQPYTIGHWGYSETVGWAWVSDESFGWATYHYGRWTRLVGTGWVWIPGTQWGPAWVSWRRGDDYVGWAPLPPESRLHDGVSIGDTVDDDYKNAPLSYAFVPIASMGDEDLSREIMRPEQNVTIINNTVNITDIRVNNTVVINRGPAIVILRNRVRHPIEVVHVFPGRGPHHPHPPKGVVYIPGSIVEHRPSHPQMPVVRERLPKAVVDRGTAPVAQASGTLPVSSQERKFPHSDPRTASAPQGPRSVGQPPSRRSESGSSPLPPSQAVPAQSPGMVVVPVHPAPPSGRPTPLQATRIVTPPQHQAAPTAWPTPVQPVGPTTSPPRQAPPTALPTPVRPSRVVVPEQPRRVMQDTQPVQRPSVPPQPQRLAPIERPAPPESRPRVEAPVRERPPEPVHQRVEQPPHAEHSKGDAASPSPNPKDKAGR